MLIPRPAFWVIALVHSYSRPIHNGQLNEHIDTHIHIYAHAHTHPHTHASGKTELSQNYLATCDNLQIHVRLNEIRITLPCITAFNLITNIHILMSRL
jgi:hypothetical protein